MTNYEWVVTHEKEIIEDILANYLGKKKGKVSACDDICCSECDLGYSHSCIETTKEWLEAEYEPLYKKGDVVIDKEGNMWVIDNVCDDMVEVYTKTNILFATLMSAIKIKDITKKVGNIYTESEVEE